MALGTCNQEQCPKSHCEIEPVMTLLCFSPHYWPPSHGSCYLSFCFGCFWDKDSPTHTHACCPLPAAPRHSTRWRVPDWHRWFQLAEPEPCTWSGRMESKQLALWASMMDRGIGCWRPKNDKFPQLSFWFFRFFHTVFLSLLLSKIYPCFRVQFMSHFLCEIFSDSSSVGLFLSWISVLLTARTSCENITLKHWLHIMRPEPHCAKELL